MDSRSGPSTPPLQLVVQVLTALEAHGVSGSVGGSGLLAALGLVDHVRDWDVTTDGDVTSVEAALAATGAQWADTTSGDAPYATRARYTVSGEGHEVDVIVGFALHGNHGVVALPARATRVWRGLPIADPVVWLSAYRLLGRHDKADLLAAWVARQHPSA